MNVTSGTNLTVLSIISASIAFTCGLLWNDAIQTAIARWFPDTQENSTTPTTTKPNIKAIWAKFIFALLFTICIIILLLGLSNIFRKLPHSKNLSLFI